MSEKKFIIVPTVQLRYKSLLLYNKFWFDVNYSRNYSNLRYNGQKEQLTYSGSMTKGAKKRIERAVDLLLMISPQQKVLNPITNKYNKFQLTFITLTISDDTKIYDGKFCNDNLLKPFLRWLREVKKVKSYLWKLELQERGQPHYHITTNEFIRFDEICNKWNLLQKELGMLNDFKSRFGHYNPNSTDIHQVYKIQDIKAYLVKYLSKADKSGKKVNCKVWDCSENLKGKKYFEFDFDDLTNYNFIDFYNNSNTTLFKNEHCEILKNKVLKTTSILNDKQLKEFKVWLNEIKR
jgi:hypothetical protein